MTSNTFNSKLFESFDCCAFIERLTGQSMETCVDEQLRALGLPWFPTLDPIYGAIAANIGAMVETAFLAGYKVGRNPDLLLLAADDSGEGAE